MATDVIIDPANGQIYWNDGTGSPQSISIGGNAQDTISITGYGAAYSPGSTPAQSSAGVLVKFTDLATGTLTPGTNAYELGSGALRWKFFGTTTNISDNSSALGTNTFSLLTGLVQINGGTAISGNVGIGQTLFIYNSTDPRYFVGFRSSASLASTQTYTLPLTYPSTGSSVLQSDTAGTLTWVPMTASSPGGSGNTAQNINIVSATTGTFYPLFTNTSSTTSGTVGVAVSVDANLSFDAASNVLIVDGLTLGGSGATTTFPYFEIGNTSGIAQTLNFATTGTGAKQFNFGTSSASASTATFFGSVTANYLIYNTGSGGVLRIQTDVTNSRVRMFENMTTSGTLGFFGTSGGTLYLGTDSGTSNGDITLRGNFTNGGGGNQRAAIFTLATATSNGTGVGGTMVFQTSTSSTSGSASNALRSRLRIEGAATGTSNLESIIILGDATSGTAWSSYIRGVDASGTDVEAGEIQIQAGRSTGTGAARGISFYVSPSSTTSSTINAASQIARFSATGLTIYSTTNSTSTTTGALVVAGGAGIAATLNVGGTISSIGASIYGVVYTNNIQIGQGGNNINFLDATGATLGNFNTSNGWFRSAQTTSSSSTTTGALVSAGGLGIAGNAFIGGTVNVTSSTSSINSGTGALVVTGGLGLVGNAFIGGTVTITNTSASGNTDSGALVVKGGAGFGGSVNIFGQLGVGGTLDYLAPNLIAWFSSSVNSYAQVVAHNHSNGNSASTDFIVSNDLSTDTSTYGDFGINSSGWAATTSPFNTANSSYLIGAGGDLVVGTVTANSIRIAIGSTIFETVNINSTGTAVSITPGTASGTTSSGALTVFGGVGIGGSVNIGKSLNLWNPAYTFSTNLASGAVTATTNYILPTAYPSGTGTSYLSASTTGVMAWVAAPTGGGGTPGGSNKQIQYNNSSTFGGASGFEYTTGGIGNTVSIFSTTGTGYTAGFWVSAIGATTRVGIGLSNPQFELEILGEISATNKSFVINHPTKPNMKLRYGSLEGPENGVYVRGVLIGNNIIETPDYWVGLVDPDTFTVDLTPIGKFAQLYVEKIEDYKVYVGNSSATNIHCFYTVWAERKDIPKLVTEY